MSLGELIYYTSRGRADFIAIPVFPSRMFRHGFIFCRNDSGIERAGDLSGRKLGFLRWVQTAAIWMRGMLVDDYGVSVSGSQWYAASMHHWDDHDPGATVAPRDGSVIRMIDNDGKTTSERACRALFDRQVDALGVTESQLPMLLANDSVKRLFADARRVEADYFRATRILPIMHVLAVQKKLVERHAELPAQLFQLYVEAKRWAQHWRRSIPSLAEAWSNHYLADERDVFRGDPWAYGLAANRQVLDKFFAYCHAQGISGRAIAPEEIFHPSTHALSE
jgi:4,5-dihydroxyphthalate decarboxylase